MARAEPGAVGSLKRFDAARRSAMLIALAVLVAALSCAATAEPMQDVDYVAIPPQPSAAPDKIEVIEFFYYGCESCNRLEPQLRSWLKTLAPDIAFRRVPALRRSAWVPLTRVYFSLEELGELERLHSQVYQAVHDAGLNLGNSSELLPWAQSVGLDRDKLEQFLESDVVTARVQRAHDATVAYGIRATPSFVVDGRYLTSGRMAGSLDALLPVVDGLIDKVRTNRGLK